MNKYYTIILTFSYNEGVEAINSCTKYCDEMTAALEGIKMLSNHLILGDKFVSLEIKERTT